MVLFRSFLKSSFASELPSFVRSKISQQNPAFAGPCLAGVACDYALASALPAFAALRARAVFALAAFTTLGVVMLA